MEVTDQELAFEEQRQKLMDLASSLNGVKTAIDELASSQPEPVTDVNVKGEVKVSNQPETLAVSNLDALKDYFDTLASDISSAIKENAPNDTIKIANPVETVKVSNLTKLENRIDRLAKAIEDTEPVHVERQDVSFPNTAKDYVSVRLTDGKSFYKTMNQVATALQKLPLVISTETGEYALAVANADGTPIEGGTSSPVTEVDVVSADSSHALASSEPSITQGVTIAVDESTHAHSASGVTITQTHAITPDESTHSHTSDESAVTINATVFTDQSGATFTDQAGNDFEPQDA